MPGPLPELPRGTGLRTPAGPRLTHRERERQQLIETFKGWSPEAQERALDIIQARELNPWRPFYCPNPRCDGRPHGNWKWNHARADQRPPSLTDLDWLTWLLLGGRGSGKTRTGSEAIHKLVKRVPRVNLIAPTAPDLRETMVEGESGLQATAPPDFMPQWEPSKKKLTWPNGATALGFSGEEPDRLRGPQCYAAWIDEPAAMPAIGGEGGVWDNVLFGLRLGRRIGWTPRVIATTTPRPTKWMKALVADPATRLHRVSSYANIENLAETYKVHVLGKYEGTRLGRQEIDAELIEEVEGALWKGAWIHYVETVALTLVRLVVAIDPAGTANKKSDETGIVVLGVDDKGVIYVLQDLTDKYSPSGWATAAVHAYEHWHADAIVAETNYGGDMVKEVLEKNGAKNIKIETVHSRRGKAIRAEPIAALYEKGHNTNQINVYHLKGKLAELEDEQTTWVPGEGPSPNRLDALVHGATALARTSAVAGLSAPSAETMPELAAAIPGLAHA